MRYSRGRPDREAKREGRQNNRNVGTLGDTLSRDGKWSLQRLLKRLIRRSEATVNAQLDRSHPPWREHDIGTKSEEKSPSLIAFFGYDSTDIGGESTSGETPFTATNLGRGTPSAPAGMETGKTSQRTRSERKSGLRGAKPMLRNKLTSPSGKVDMKTASRSDTAVARRGRQKRKEPFQFWELSPDANVRQELPTSVSKQHRTEFDNIVSGGVPASYDDSGDPLWVVIGLDFGTSSTKVICQMPYESGRPSIAIPAPVCLRSSGHPYLWRTVVWFRKSGEFTPYPDPSARFHQNLKQGVTWKSAKSPMKQSVESEAKIYPPDAVIAYLTYVIRYVKGWLALERPTIFRGRRPRWFVNLGLAAANYDDKDLFRRYRKVGATAMVLADSGNVVSLEAIKIFQKHRAVVRAANSDDGAEELGIAVIPETAAAATGFAKSPGRPDGLYLMVDVGAMTLDVCTFRLNKGQASTDQYNLMEADVRPLGVEAFYQFREMGRSQRGFERQCDHCLGEVLRKTKETRDPYAECWEPGNEIPVFFTGGGSHNRLHKKVIEGLAQRLGKDTTRTDGIQRIELPVPDTIDCPEPVADVGRLAVAFGLSYPPTEIGKISPPSFTEDILRQQARDYGKRLVSKAQV